MTRTDKLDPIVELLLEVTEARADPPFETLEPEEARALVLERMRAIGGAADPVHAIENRTIPGPGGAIPIRIYRPSAEMQLPAMVYFHGGGWVVCNLDTHHAICSGLANASGVVVISVDYRLAPDHKFPAAVDDAYAATVWAAENASRLGIDPARISVVGDSAGGNLAAVVAIKCRDENGPSIARQALVYPVTDLSRMDTGSYEEFASGYQLTRADMMWFRKHYLSSDTDRRHPHVSPLLAEDLSGLPPALIITAECDPLRDEGEAYAERLKKAGVAVTLHRYDGMIHPFFSLGSVIPQGLDAIQEVADFATHASHR